MRTDLTGPCHNCPFKREGGIRVHPARAREIAQSQIEGQGATFACHKTTMSDLGSEDGDLVAGPNSQYCGGALAFAAKLDTYNQMLRIAIRLALWDPQQIGAQARAEVFGSVLEMVAAQTPRTMPKSRKPMKHTIAKRRSF
jgi:hypothetical protein